ncbi:MAG: Dyp-type peroxidase, partial [Anaerolineae bacterium]|nr:Dyp-type peroxidase [Anaerolineae bacterium]
MKIDSKELRSIWRRSQVALVVREAIGKAVHMLSATLDRTQVDIDDPDLRGLFTNLQANILKSHGRDHVACLFLRFTAAPSNVKHWIAHFAAEKITSCREQFAQSQRFKAAWAEGITLDQPVISFLLSADGYRYLGFDPAHFGPGEHAFRRGMKYRPSGLEALANRLLGTATNDPDPAVWESAYQGTIHAMILVARDNHSRLDEDVHGLTESLSAIATVLTVEYGGVLRAQPSLDAAGLPLGKGRTIEHFGFVDGRSNPVFLKDDYDREAQLGVAHYDPSAPLGLALVADPFAPQADSCGSFLVFRKLQQDVPRFHHDLEALAQELGVSPALAGSWLVGRFADGTPVTQHGHDGLPEVVNDFNYTGRDDAGLYCPPQAHIRKTNPRGSGLLARFDDDRKRRIVRRGIPYGAHVHDVPAAEETGLLFMCYQSDIGRQFEHVQRRWAENRGFPNTLILPRTGADPILSQRRYDRPTQRWARAWGERRSVYRDFGNFVGLRGGEYFFAPSLSFLHEIDRDVEEDDVSTPTDPRSATGEWRLLPYGSEVEAVHLSLLHTGKVLYYSGFRVAELVKTQTRVWNPKTGEIKQPDTPSDLFCAGHAFLPDGRLLSTGGTLEYRNLPAIPPWVIRNTRPIAPFVTRLYLRLAKLIPALATISQFTLTGSTQLYMFNPLTEQWEYAGDMPEGRWYPSNTCLPNGRMLLLSGTNEGGARGEHAAALINRRVEVFDPVHGLEQVSAIPVTAAPQHGGPEDDDGHHEDFPTVYPRMHVLPLSEADKTQFPAGKAFCSGYGAQSKMLNLSNWEWTDVARLNWAQRDDGCSVLLPLRTPEYRARVLTFGGHRPIGGGDIES